MPTVLRFDGFRVAIYPNDHRPAHVHVSGADGEAIFLLDCPDGPVRLREAYGLSNREIGRIASVLDRHMAALCEAWSRFHDRDG
jgi:hypothetical protein